MNKKLFGALALSVALGACTSEEELVISTGNGQLANRPSLGQVELTTSAESRAIVADKTWGGLKYEIGESIGAALVDEVVLTGKEKGFTYANYVAGDKVSGKTFAEAEGDASNFYALCGSDNYANQIHTNYGYKYSGTGWSSEASLVEGHYMFYFPYNMNNSSRLPINIGVPTVQNCSEDNSAIDAFYKGETPIAVDVKFLQKPAAGQKTKVSASPVHLFAFPRFTIVNDFEGYLFQGKYPELDNYPTKVKPSMTIKKVEFVYQPNAAEVKLWHKAAINANNLNEKVEAKWEDKKFSVASYTSGVTDGNLNNIDFEPAISALWDNATTAAGYSNEQVITCVIDRDIANGDEYSFYAIMPAEDYGMNLKARVYVTVEGKEYILMATGAYNETPDVNGDLMAIRPSSMSTAPLPGFGKKVQLVRGERYPIIEYNTDSDGKTSVKKNAGKVLTLSLASLDAYETGKYVAPTYSRGVANNEEFIALMDEYTRGTTLIEVANNVGDQVNEYEFAIGKTNTVVLNAELVKALYTKVVLGGNAALKFEYTNLPIANDVKVEYVSLEGSYYKYTLTAGETTVTVLYNKSIVEKTADKLADGITVVTAAGTLNKVASDYKVGDDRQAIVYVTGSPSKYSIGSGADGFKIIFEVANAELDVTADCNAEIIAESAIKINMDGALKNAANKYADGSTFKNNKLKTIAASTGNCEVSAQLNEWPSEVPATSKVNNVTILPTSEVADFEVTQRSFEAFKVSNTIVTLGSTITSFLSRNDIDLSETNIVTLESNATDFRWKSGNGKIYVDHLEGQLKKISAGEGVIYRVKE